MILVLIGFVNLVRKLRQRNCLIGITTRIDEVLPVLILFFHIVKYNLWVILNNYCYDFALQKAKTEKLYSKWQHTLDLAHSRNTRVHMYVHSTFACRPRPKQKQSKQIYSKRIKPQQHMLNMTNFGLVYKAVF